MHLTGRSFLILFTLFSCNALAQRADRRGSLPPPTNQQAQQTTTQPFVPGGYQAAQVFLPFQEADFNQDAEGPSALVIYLHGHSGNGNDNASQLRTGGVAAIANYLSAQKMKSVFLVPQCPADRMWNEGGAAGGNVMSSVVKSWIDSFVQSHDIDRQKIYILGASSGGAGVWRMVSDYPAFFAAAMPAVSTPRMVDIKKVKQTPVCAVIGAADEVVSAERVGPFIKQLQQNGGEVKFQILPGSDHQSAVSSAFSADCLLWVFSHTRPAQ